MKKLLFTACVLTLTASVFAQGTVVFQGSNTTGRSRVWYNANVFTAVRGNGPTDLPAGSQDWAGYTALTGSGYMAALLCAPSGQNPESLMVWSTTTSVFRTGTAAGIIAQAATDAVLPNVAAETAASLEIFAWDTKGGLYSTAQAGWDAWKAGLTSGGTSALLTIDKVGGGQTPSPSLANAVGYTSFNIYTIPEPSTMALAGLGAAALLIFRRRK